MRMPATRYAATEVRLAGHSVDTAQTLSFRFDGRRYTAHPGDTVASALLAHNVHFVARSFKYHRPRGIYTAGSEEPSALLTIGHGGRQEPNTRATVAEVYDGLEARSQNHRGSLKYDLMAVNDLLLSKFLGAGFYYKTFMWPASFWEKVYEPAIRHAAGLGALSAQPDSDIYDHGYLHCDVLIVGSGPAGLAAALTAGRSGLRVIVAEEDFLMGGRLIGDSHTIDNAPARDWVTAVLDELAQMPHVRLMKRTCIYGTYDHGIYGALERQRDHMAPSTHAPSTHAPPTHAPSKHATTLPRQVLWRIYAKRCILAAGASERGIAFAHNDRPGIMLSGAVRAYANRWGVACGRAVSIFTNNDDGWHTARDLHRHGVNVCAVIDSRDKDIAFVPEGVRHIRGAEVVSTKGRHRLKSITLSTGERIHTDCLAVSGGWNPVVHLSSHHRSRPRWNDAIAAFVPGDDMPPGMVVAGAANGIMTLRRCLQAGMEVARDIATELGKKSPKVSLPKTDDEPESITALWHVGDNAGKSWLDMQNDVTVKDVVLAHQEGFRSVEHLKRYTTLGMATDQGKTSNVAALAVMATCSGQSIRDTGTTVFRPPYSPVAIGAFAGRARGKEYRPTRLTPSHVWAEQAGAVFVETGMWLRAQWFVKSGETHWRESVDREVRQTRGSVGVCDVSTLGKIDIQGRDAAQFLSLVYSNGFMKLATGRVRYGLMLREDGIVMDDGTTARLSENHFVMTTTTANAVGVFRHLEFVRQCLHPDWDVHLISTTEQYAQFAVAGPNARQLLREVVDLQYDISNEAFPYMACAEITVCNGMPARLFRISFSGELAYEIAVPTRYGHDMMDVLMVAGATFGVAPYGTEALGVMRIEKGHAAGGELNGQTTARDLGMATMVSAKKDCIGNVLSKRSELDVPDRPTLMGFVPVDKAASLEAGAHFISPPNPETMEYDEGWMSAVTWSPELGHSIGLGFIKNGATRKDEIVLAVDPLRGKRTQVKIVSPHFIDPTGERLRG